MLSASAAMNEYTDITIAILAGGKSSRMGQNKALLPFGTESMIERVVATARSITDRILVVTNSPAEYVSLGLAMTPDRFIGIGPLGGIHAALSTVSTPRCLVLACDLPLLSTSLLHSLLQTDPGADAIVLSNSGKLEPLCAVYATSLLALIEEHIHSKNFAVHAILEKVRVQRVDISAQNNWKHQLTNVNTPEDANTARSMGGFVSPGAEDL